ncbi:MAG TPA: hypothetical protein VGQ83_21730 [Polyangia bacterium]|jgi:hypothetical protein
MIAVHPVDGADPGEGADVRAQVRRLGLTEAVYLDADFKAVRELRGSVYPTFALIDRQGMVRYRLAGALTNRGERALTDEIEKLLAEK